MGRRGEEPRERRLPTGRRKREDREGSTKKPLQQACSGHGGTGGATRGAGGDVSTGWLVLPPGRVTLQEFPHPQQGCWITGRGRRRGEAGLGAFSRRPPARDHARRGPRRAARRPMVCPQEVVSASRRLWHHQVSRLHTYLWSRRLTQAVFFRTWIRAGTNKGGSFSLRGLLLVGWGGGTMLVAVLDQ